MKITMGRLTALTAVVCIAGSSGVWAGDEASGSKDKAAAACASGVCALSSAPRDAGKAMPGTLNTAGLSALLRAKTPVVVLDARSGKWDDGKRIPGAKAVNADSTDAEIAAAAPDKQALVVTYCSNTKCQASPKLAAKLASLGYGNVVEYPEGIAGWISAGNAVEQTKN